MNTVPLVSVIIPVYNKSSYIERSLNSVINQTYQNIECLVVDDASTDDSLAKVHETVDGYSGDIKFLVFARSENKGASAVRNFAIRQAKGDYLFFLDADDELPLDSISLLVDKVSLHPGVDIVQGNMLSFPYKDYYELRRFGLPDYYSDNESVRSRYYDVYKDFPIPVCNKLVRKDFLVGNGLFLFEGIHHEDEHWTAIAVRYCGSMAFEYSYTYYRYFVPDSVMMATNDERSARAWGLLLYDLAAHFDEWDFLRQYKRFLRDLAVWYYIAPKVPSLKKAHLYYSKLATEHRLFLIATILSISRKISFCKFGREVGKALTIRWIHRK